MSGLALCCWLLPNPLPPDPKADICPIVEVEVNPPVPPNPPELLLFMFPKLLEVVPKVLFVLPKPVEEEVEDPPNADDEEEKVLEAGV